MGKTPEIPVSEFRVAEGMVALTLDVHGVNPITMSVEASKLDENLRAFEPTIDPTGKGRRDWSEYAQILSLVATGLRQVNANGGNNRATEGVCWAGLWCAFNHPKMGDAMKRQVSEAIRRTGKAHITLALDARGVLGLALADKFAELTPILNAADASEPVVLAVQREVKPGPMH
jgi:hypothetical protein